MDTDIIKVGTIFYDGARNKNHVINIFKHKGEVLVVSKYWIKRRLRWYYSTKPLWSLMIQLFPKDY